MRKWMALAVLLFVLAGCSSAAVDASGRTIIRIAYLPITHSAAVMVLPQVTKDDENFHVQLERFTAWPEVVEALRAGHVDGASILFEVAVRAFEMDNSLRAVSLSHRDGNVIVVDNTVRGYQDLIGRTVAIPHALSPHNTLLRMVFEREGIDVNDVNLIDLSPTEMPFTMAARAISAYVVAEPWGSLAEARGVGHILETSNEILPDSVCCVMLFNSNIFDRHDGLYDWFMEQFAAAAALAQARHEMVMEAFRRSTSFERYIIERSLENTNFENLEFTLADFEIITENILRLGVLDEVPDFNDFILGGCCR